VGGQFASVRSWVVQLPLAAASMNRLRWLSCLVALTWCGALLRAAPLGAAAHGGAYRATAPIPPSWAPDVGGSALAHGGMYRGAAPGTLAPGSGIVNTPLGVGPTTRSGAGLDTSRWQAWWEFNKDAYVRVKESAVAARGPALQPTLEQIDKSVVPTLVAALRATKQPDLASACLVALGKISPDPVTSGYRDIVIASLRGAVQEVRETAALSLGIARAVWAVDDLLALLADDPKGRRLLDRERVEERTRAFSAYALGLIAERADDMKLRARIVTALAQQLERARDKDQDLALAAVHGLRLACPAISVRSLEAWSTIQLVTDALWKFATRRGDQGEQLVQAHALLAVAQAAQGDAAAVARYQPTLLEELAERGGRAPALAQSAALGLGLLAPSSDRVASLALQRAVDHADDRQTRSFALIALGQIGGDLNRTFLVKTLTHGHKATVRPWAALALGILRHRMRDTAGAQSAEDRAVDKALLDALVASKTTDVRGAYAVALGLAGHVGATKALRAAFDDADRQDEVAGYLALALGMLGDQTVVPALQATAKKALRRPVLMRQLGVALALLGDRDAAVQLLELMRGGDVNVATLATVAGALGQVGDARALGQLTAIVKADRTPDLARAFAAAALGGIADDDAQPWSASLSIGVNYASALPTLTNGTSGVLDIL
jgi:hypothetical protein